MFKTMIILFLMGLLLFLSGCVSRQERLADLKQQQRWDLENKADQAYSDALGRAWRKSDAAYWKKINAPGYVGQDDSFPQGFIIRRSAGKIKIIPLDGNQPVMTIYTPDN